RRMTRSPHRTSAPARSRATPSGVETRATGASQVAPVAAPHRIRPAVIVFLLSLAVLAVNAAHYRAFFDDAFVSLRYVDRFVHGQGLTWTDGERVEGYSNLSWILLLSVPGALGFDLVASARVLGMLASMGVVAAFCAAYVLGAVRSTRVVA